jgi:hypothetical protein
MVILKPVTETQKQEVISSSDLLFRLDSNGNRHVLNSFHGLRDALRKYFCGQPCIYNASYRGVIEYDSTGLHYVERHFDYSGSRNIGVESGYITAGVGRYIIYICQMFSLRLLSSLTSCSFREPLVCRSCDGVVDCCA